MAVHNDFGKNGEQLAKDYLIGEGYELLDENWVSGKAEVDLIFLRAGVLIFVEVKTRSSSAFGEPTMFVNEQKVKQLAHAAKAYIEIMDHKGEIRFDVISILFTDKVNYKLEHIEDAFWP